MDASDEEIVVELIDGAHEWVSFEDGDGDTWVFDATFLASNWQCIWGQGIWGQGCPGILSEPTPELGQGCCSLGAHFADADDRRRVEAAARRLDAEHWHQHGHPQAGRPTTTDSEGLLTTRVVDDACIFHNPPDASVDPGCALHIGAVAAGEAPHQWKPEVCWQLPLRLEQHADDNGHQVFTLREWKRRDWGEGGDDLHWWCTEDGRAFVGHEPVYRHLRVEIVEMVGEVPYRALARHLDRRRPEHLLPHPSLRVRSP